MDERKRFLQDVAVGAIYAYWRQRHVGYSQVKVIERTVEIDKQNDCRFRQLSHVCLHKYKINFAFLSMKQ